MNATPLPFPADPIVLHGFALSGHSHRVQLFLSLLGLPSRFVPVDLVGGAHKSPAFLALNAFGQVPVIEDGDVTLADSNAILVYLASRYGAAHWYPHEPLAAARIQRWLSVAAGPLVLGPAAARRAAVFGAKLDTGQAKASAHALFGVMESVLQRQPFLAGEAPTIADIANYSYSAIAPEGGVALDDHAHLRAWLARIEALPGFVAMPRATVQG